MPTKSAIRRAIMLARAITPTSCHGFHACTRPKLQGSSFCGGHLAHQITQRCRNKRTSIPSAAVRPGGERCAWTCSSRAVIRRMKTGPVLSHRASGTSNRPRDRCEPCGISYCICVARYLPDDYSIARVVEKVLVATFKVIFKAEDLKTIVSTDDPKL